MGDAGPLSLSLDETANALPREITVLVTGFGPFKSFRVNPSHLIATRLPSVLLPKIPSEDLASSTSAAVPVPPVIRILVHPSPIRVAYGTVSMLVPQLLAQHNPDYIFHIGMAGGRDYYTLETLAHRDGYRIRDVDNMDGYLVGERRWRTQECPEILDAAWDRADVLGRWKEGLDEGHGQAPVDVRLSSDAGRFLCDFIFYESLSTRFKEEQKSEGEAPGEGREGKVCFLHVPGDTDAVSVERGVRVAEAAIRSVVSSWEEGYRREGSKKAGIDFAA